MGNPFDPNFVPEMTPEDDKAMRALWPDAPHLKDRAAMDAETRKLEFEARKAEADAKRVAQLNTLTDADIKRLEIQERIADKDLEKEKVKKGNATKLPAQADPNSIKLKTVRNTDVTDKAEKPYFLFEPYLIDSSVIGFYGRGGTGKSSLLATIAAILSDRASTLWISTEETEQNILNRYMKPVVSTGDDGKPTYSFRGHDATLQVFQAVITRVDKDGRAIESMFNVYEHLEPAIIAANTNVINLPSELAKPLKLIVLDTIVALTTWDRQAGSNSDEGVKRLMAYLRSLALKYSVTIAVVGHANKGKHDHFADSVMGASAWTTSPRLSFVHGKDRVTEGQIIVRWAKGNEVQEFAQLFRLHMVHELAQIADGPKAGMSKVEPLARVWGSMQALELWDDVTTVPKSEEDGQGDGRFTGRRRRDSTPDKVLAKLVEMVHAGQDEVITRPMVEAQFPDLTIHRAQWTQVDEMLLVTEFANKVTMTTGPKGMILYRKADG